MTTNHDLQAGRLILAVADGNTAAVSEVIREVAPRPWELLDLITALASVAIESARMVSGDEWQNIMRTALNTIEIEGIEQEVEQATSNEDDKHSDSDADEQGNSTQMVAELQPDDHARAAQAALAYHRGDEPALNSTLDAANAQPGGVAALIFALLGQLDATARALLPADEYEQRLAAIADNRNDEDGAE